MRGCSRAPRRAGGHVSVATRNLRCGAAAKKLLLRPRHRGPGASRRWTRRGQSEGDADEVGPDERHWKVQVREPS